MSFGESKPDTGLIAGLEALLRRLVHLEPGEAPRLLLSFATFFCVLCGYYVMRPVRDEMGVAVGTDGLERLFYWVFLTMLAAVPVFGTLTASFARRRIVPIVYGFFILNLFAFWLALDRQTGAVGTSVGSIFFVWSSVFNLFVVSMFWILMSELYDGTTAKRLYGFIAAGGTAGAVTGPVIARYLAPMVDAHDLLLVTAAFLSLALAAVLALRRITADDRSATASDAEKPVGGRDILSGATHVLSSRYLLFIALFILLANLIGTYFYLEQSRIVGATIVEKSARVQFFAGRDFAVNAITLAVQLLLTGRLMERFGLALSLAALPATAIAGLAALAISPTLEIVAAVMVAERAVAFSLTNPAVKVLWTAVPLDEKYKAQSFVDTVVYRGGDAASGWVFNSFAKSIGASGTLVAAATLPLALVWLWIGLSLSREQKERAAGA